MDPLKFQVAITDNATSTLETIQKLLNNLKDVTINVAGGGDIKSLLSSLEKSGSVAVSAEKAAAALKKEEEALLRLKDAAAFAARETERLEGHKQTASSYVSEEKAKLDVLKNSGDAARKAAEEYKQYSEYVRKANEELSKIKTYSLNPVKSIEDSTKKSFAELRDYYRRMLYSFANSAGRSFGGDQDLLAAAKASIAKYREELVRLRDESKNLFANTGDKSIGTMTRSLERMLSEYDKVIGKYDEMRTKAKEGVKYYDLDGQIRQQQFSLQQRVKEEARVNEQLSQAKQNQAQLNQQIVQQEQKVAEARERLAQATQKQHQGDQQTAQTLNAEAQAAGQAAGQLSKLLADKNAVTEAENKLAQASMMNVAAFIAEGEAAQKAAGQIGAIVGLLQQISQLRVPDTSSFAQSLSQLATVKTQGTGLEQLGAHLGDAAEKIEAAKNAIKGGRFGELAKRIQTATEKITELNTAFEKFHLTIGKDQGLKDFMTGLGEVIRNVRVQMQSLGAGESSGLGSIAKQYNRNVEQMEDALYRLQEARIKVANAIKMGESAGMDVSNWRGYLQFIEAYERKLQNIKANESMMFGDGWQTKAFGTTFKSLLSNADDFERMAKKAAKENDAWAKSMRDAANEANKLDIKIRELKRVEATGSAAGANTSQLREYIHQLEIYKSVLESIAGGYKGVGHTVNWINGSEKVSGYDTLANTKRLADESAKAVNRETQEIERNKSKKQEAAGAANQLTAEQQRLAQALNQTSESAKGQSQILSDLKSMAMQYLGVWGGQQFLRNIIEIGGQLEMQRLSIGAILQNQSQANDLFEKIKGLALQSPFGVVELDQMTKQLTAYGFKYSELFDMTKRLADISAATGTGVDRLALALGHVRSEAALSGYTLRQFSMANVPLLQKLSEKLGKTTQEIRKMVRSKEISYEDVLGVLKDLTNEGGMFYNMQETISQSVKARFKNVKDAMDIMYGEMAEGGIGELLKDIADMLMKVTRNWKDAATILGTGAAVWATQRVAVMAYASAVGKSNMAVISSIAAHRQKEAAILRDAAGYRALTLAESQQLAMSKKLTLSERTKLLLGRSLSKARMQSLLLARRQQTADMTLALSQKKLTTEMVLRQVAYGKLTKAQAVQIFNSAKLSLAEKRAALAALQHTQQLKGLSLALDVVGYSVKKAALALGAMAPQLLFMGAITALMELWQSHNQQMERAEELGQSIYQQSQDAIKNTKVMLQEYDAVLSLRDKEGKLVNEPQFSGLNLKNVSNAKITFPEFDTEIAEQAVEKWIQYISDNAANAGDILNKALFNGDELLPLTEQYKNLAEAVNTVVLAQYALQDMGDVFENSVKSTNSNMAIDDDVITNLKDYNDALKDANRWISKLYTGKDRANLDKGIAFAQSHSKAFAEATKDVETYGEAFDILMKRYKEFPEEVATVSDFAGFDILEGTANDKVRDMIDARKTLDDDLQTFYTELKANLETKGVDVQHMSEAQQQALLLGYKKTLEESGNLSEDFMKQLMIEFAHEFNIPINLDDAKFIPKISEAKRLLKELTGEDWKVDLRFATNIKDVIDEARKQYKAAKEFYANAEPVMLKFGIKMKIGDTLTDEQIAAIVAKAPAESQEFLKQLLKGANEASKLFNQATEASKNGGFSLEDPTKKKKEKKKTGSKKTYKDPVAEEWKERIRLLKDANQLYKEWNKRTGEEDAMSRVRQQYGDIFEKWKTDKNVPWKDFKAEDIIEYRNYIQKIVDEAQKRYDSQRNDKAKNYGKEAEAVLREGKKLLDDIDRYDFDEKAREFKTGFDKALDDMTRRWNIFTSVRSATGNKLLAFDMAGIDEGSRNLRNAADAMKDKLADEMQRVGGNELLAKIPFNIDIDEEKLRDQFKAALGDSKQYATTIDGLVDAYKKWQRLQQDVVKSDIDVFAKLIGSVESYSAQISKINDELEQQTTAIANSGASPSQQAEAVAIAESQADWKKMKLSADYSNLYNKTIALSRIEFENAADAVQKMIERLRELGTISPDEYLQEIDKLNKARMEWSTTGFLGERGAFGQFISGGNQGLMDYYQQRADAARRRADYLKDTGKDATKDEAEARHYQKLYESLKKLTDEAGKVVTAFQTLQSGIDVLKNLFDSLGMEGASNAMDDAGGILGGALQGASALSALGPYGMAAGAALGLVSGIAQVHDKALERHINKLREDVKSIESNTELIAKARERTLGYDMGDVRRQMAQQYATKPYNGQGNMLDLILSLMGGNRQNKSMYEYYSKNSQGTGYQQEYNNLIQQRKDYMEILKDQQDKKKKSNDEIEETKAKIAELDDQIAYFSQDLAKELWSIDIKGWADQLSDALASAFENGENMAKAYRDTVTSIIQQMMQKMMQLAILEPMFERLQKQLFGENGKGGLFDPNNPKGSMSKVTAMIADFFGKGGEGEKAITASMEFMTAFQRGMQNAGLTVLNEASNTLSSSMQGTTEETSGLLAGYVNALRQDVSVNRILITQFVSQMWPDYIETFANQVTAVQNIDTNVQVIMTMMQMGNGAMYEQIAAMRSRIDNVVMGIDKFSIR